MLRGEGVREGTAFSVWPVTLDRSLDAMLSGDSRSIADVKKPDIFG